MWNVVRCEVRGREHIKTGEPCQDKTYHMNDKDVDVIALADGAGSAKLSHFGAELVTKQICKLFVKRFVPFYDNPDGVSVKKNIIDYLIGGLKNLTEEYGCEISDLSSTLLVVAVHDQKFIIAHIGDGVIGYLKNDELNVASHPDNGEFTNTTVFINSAHAMKSMRLIKGQLNGIRGFVLMSDGTENCLYDKNKKFLSPVIKKIMDISKIMKEECLNQEVKNAFEKTVKKNTFDDCSIALCIEEDYSFPGYNYLTVKQKKEILQLGNDRNHRRLLKRLRRYDEILNFTCVPRTVFQVSKKIHLKEKYCRKHVNLLLSRNLILMDNNLIYTAVILER